jgi:hypothetical protein
MPPSIGARRAALILAAVAAFTAAAPAQIVYVKVKDAKSLLKRFPANTIDLRGDTVLVGEMKAGVTFTGGRFNYQGNDGNNEFYVVNNADPAVVPYDVVDGAAVPGKVKNGVVTLKGREIADIQYLLRNTSLYGLAREYAQRKLAVATLLKARDVNKSATPEWLLAHARYVTELERLQAWLANTIYPEAAKKLQPDIDKQRKSVAKEAREQRLAESLASIKVAAVPPRLEEVAKSVAPGARFRVVESRHLRVTCLDSISEIQAKELVELGEKIIDGFRVSAVDPWLGDDFKDTIPDTQFIEFWFGPDEGNAHEHFLTDYYGLSWGDHKEQRIAALSGAYRRKQAPEYLEYWKIADNKDFDGIVAHDLGHVLANLHWNQGRADSAGALPDFLFEGLAYELSLSWLGRNSVTCKEFVQEQYAKPKGASEVANSIRMGELELYAKVALESGPPVDALIRKPLHQMSDGDLAKSWSFVEFLLTQKNKPGQLFLRQLCDVISKSGLSNTQIRELAEKSFGVANQDVFKVLDEQWKAHVELLQKNGPDPKKK